MPLRLRFSIYGEKNLLLLHHHIPANLCGAHLLHRSSDPVEVDEAAINGVFASCYLHSLVRHVMPTPIAQVCITRRIAQVARLADGKLTKFIGEQFLPTREHAD